MLTDNLTLIIRHANERTLEACYQLLARQVPEEQIFKVSEVPFSATLRESLKLGLEQGRKWTLCIDADVLVKENGIHEILEFGESTDDLVAEVQGICMDKFFAGSKAAGNHLYRTKYLEKAVNLIPHEKDSFRPETDMLNKLKEAGNPWLQKDSLIIGLHDEGQYYRDIFRKRFLQSFKHQWAAGQLLSWWRSQIDTDNDFLMALAGYAAGIMSQHRAEANAERYPDSLFEYSLNSYGLAEKNNSFRSPNISQEINTWMKLLASGRVKPILPLKYNQETFEDGLNNQQRPVSKQFTWLVQKYGYLKTFRWYLGAPFTKIGRMIRGN